MTDLEGAAPRHVLAVIRASFDSLTRSDRAVVGVVLDHPDEVIHLTVSEFAERAGVAESTVVRCCHKLGFRGYQDLKIRLARESAPAPSAELGPLDAGAGAVETLRTVVAIERAMLNDVLSLVDDATFTAAVDAVAAAGSVMFLGFGPSATVSAEAEEKFASIGLDVISAPVANRRILAASKLGPGDVMICVSQTGATLETISYAEGAARQGATVIALTGFARTRLGKVADLNLVTGVRDLDFRFGSLGARTAHLVLLDAVYVAVALRLGPPAADHLARYQDIESTWRL